MPTFCEATESSGLLVESVQVQELTFHHVAAMERLSDLWGKFSLSESEGSRYQVRDEQGEEEYFIAARFFTRRTISAEAIARTFRLVWRTKKGFEVRDMGNIGCYSCLPMKKMWLGLCKENHGHLINILWP